VTNRDGYVGLFGEPGAALSDGDWIAQANDSLPPNLSCLNAKFVAGSRSEQVLQVAYEPSLGAFNFVGLSGGSIAEMLDQAATHCGSFVTSFPCPTVTMTVTYLRAGTGSQFVATARAVKLNAASAVLAADLADAKGRHIASASVVSQVITDFARYT
jgi:acyl-coenzyme A thioesterase PaaI-like protein